MTILRQLERYFEFERLGTSWRTEIVAGLTTFVTMAYIILVNPSILAQAGMPVAATTAATCLAAALASLMMGVFAKYPIAMAPGMGLNAYFAYSVVKGMQVPWQVALGAVFVSGIAFFVLTVTGIREMLLRVIPKELYGAVAAGIGLFIALIGLHNAGIVVPNTDTIVTLGNIGAKGALIALGALVLIGALMVKKIPGAILIGVVTATLAAFALGEVRWVPQQSALSALGETALKLDIAGAVSLGALEIIFVFLFVDIFDNIGTLVAVGKRAGLLDSDDRIPRLHRIFLCDASATVAGSLLGTSTVVSYLESAAGVAAGGRSGMTAIVTGVLFLVALAVTPLAGSVPPVATAPALIIVGALMMASIGEIKWADSAAAIPAFLTMVMIPLTFSIATGLAFGFLSHVALKVLSGNGRTVHWSTYLLAALFLLRFVYLGRA